jgi:hypothetical protein
MLTVLTIATVFIAVVLAVVHWKTVREVLLWSAAIINVLSAFIGLLALLGAVGVFVWAAIAQDAKLVPIGIALVVAFLGFGVVAFVLNAIEEHDRNNPFAKFRAWSLARFYRDKSESPDESSDRGYPS